MLSVTIQHVPESMTSMLNDKFTSLVGDELMKQGCVGEWSLIEVKHIRKADITDGLSIESITPMRNISNAFGIKCTFRHGYRDSQYEAIILPPPGKRDKKSLDELFDAMSNKHSKPKQEIKRAFVGETVTGKIHSVSKDRATVLLFPDNPDNLKFGVLRLTDFQSFRKNQEIIHGMVVTCKVIDIISGIPQLSRLEVVGSDDRFENPVDGKFSFTGFVDDPGRITWLLENVKSILLNSGRRTHAGTHHMAKARFKEELRHIICSKFKAKTVNLAPIFRFLQQCDFLEDDNQDSYFCATNAGTDGTLINVKEVNSKAFRIKDDAQEPNKVETPKPKQPSLLTSFDHRVTPEQMVMRNTMAAEAEAKASLLTLPPPPPLASANDEMSALLAVCSNLKRIGFEVGFDIDKITEYTTKKRRLKEIDAELERLSNEEESINKWLADNPDASNEVVKATEAVKVLGLSGKAN